MMTPITSPTPHPSPTSRVLPSDASLNTPNFAPEYCGLFLPENRRPWRRFALRSRAACRPAEIHRLAGGCHHPAAQMMPRAASNHWQCAAQQSLTRSCFRHMCCGFLRTALGAVHLWPHTIPVRIARKHADLAKRNTAKPDTIRVKPMGRMPLLFLITFAE